MALSPEVRARRLKAIEERRARNRVLAEKFVKNEAKRRKIADRDARLAKAEDQIRNGKESSNDIAWALPREEAGLGGADFAIDRDEEDARVEDTQPEDEGEDEEKPEQSGAEEEPAAEPTESQAGQPEPSGGRTEPSPAQQQAERLKEELKARAPEEIKKRLADAAKKAVAKLVQRAWGAILAFLAEWWWVVLLVILAIVFLVWLFGGFSGKGIDGVGGTHKILAVPSRDQSLVDEIRQLQAAGKIGFTNGAEADLEWETVGGVLQGRLDVRILRTLKYLGNKEELIRVNISRINGPDKTRRKAVANLAGWLIQPDGDGGDRSPIDAISAYSTGQAIGIDQIGTFSDEIAAVDACEVSTNTPIDVSYQEMTGENILRPIYEQLAVDGRTLYSAAMSLMAGSAAPKTVAGESYFSVVQKNLDLLVGDLSRVIEQGDALKLDLRAIAYFVQARNKLTAVNDAIAGKEGEDLVAIWKERDKTGQPVDDGLRSMFNGMKVRNMWGWYGDTKDGCRLWKAYEANNALRKLEVDLMKMPADPMFLEAGTNFNADMVVAQTIVYSPEDGALDDNIPVLDVFPNGPKNVDVGGISFDASAADGKVDAVDTHFAGLPQDKGVFSKMGTIFVYQLEGFERAGDIMADFAPMTGPLRQMQEAMDGTGASILAGEKTELVSYKNFVHIGF